MIIFDLDGTLADCEHRRHFVDPEKNPDYYFWTHKDIPQFKGAWYSKTLVDDEYPEMKKLFKPDWKAFYEACDQDTRIIPTWKVFVSLLDTNRVCSIQIWSGRCESVRKKTEDWLGNYLSPLGKYPKELILKMRPEGDYTPDDVLKEKWLGELLAIGEQVEYVFDDRKKACDMWRRRRVFVFNVNQTGEDF